MTATLLDGRAYAATIRQELASEVAAHHRATGTSPTLAIVAIRATADPATARDIYIRQLRRTARSVGIATRLIDLPLSIDDAGLIAAIARLNVDPTVTAILVQLPLPPHLGRAVLLNAIDPAKDVDGIGAHNVGSLFLHVPTLVPATCAAVIELLDRAAIPLDGQRAVLVGASSVVGRPLGLLLLQRNATVTWCHIYTEDLGAFTRQADILIAAAGHPGLITGDLVRPGAVVVDVGINVLPDGQVVGDVEFASVCEVASALSPVPGGVGPLTNLMVMRQTLRAA